MADELGDDAVEIETESSIDEITGKGGGRKKKLEMDRRCNDKVRRVSVLLLVVQEGVWVWEALWYFFEVRARGRESQGEQRKRWGGFRDDGGGSCSAKVQLGTWALMGGWPSGQVPALVDWPTSPKAVSSLPKSTGISTK